MASKQENREADVRQETALILKERLRAWQRRGKSFLVAVDQLSKDIDDIDDNFHLAPLRCGSDFRHFEEALKNADSYCRRLLHHTKQFERKLLLVIYNRRKQQQAALPASLQSKNPIIQEIEPMECKSIQEETAAILKNERKIEPMECKSTEEETEAMLKNPQGSKESSATAKGRHIPLSNLETKFIRQNRKILVPHSFGRPRAAMNKLLRQNNVQLGPFAYFGQTAIATHESQIFQLVLTIEWNKFVESREANQVLFIGVGVQRERTAELLARTQHAIPIFYDPRMDTCIHYIGHYIPLLSTVKRFKSRPYNYMGSDRCMRIELKFNHFSEELAEAIRNGA